MKVCRTCKQSKPLSDFYWHSKNGSYQGDCKDCFKSAMREHIKSTRAARNKTSREYRAKHRDKGQTRLRRWRQSNPERDRAHNLLNKAVRRGQVVKATHCEDCGLRKQLLGHHEDYRKPLTVIWLCAMCHHIRHTRLLEKS